MKFMVGRFATAALIFVFAGSVLCAVVCPGETHAATAHLCTKTDHSCCPKSHDSSQKDQCVDTHFVGSSKYHHSGLSLTAFTFDHAEAVAFASLTYGETLALDRLPLPLQDLLSKHQILRI
jgi:hypothetical protein